MAIYGISDLHLSFGTNKPMDIFGNKWKNYEDKIKENWNNTANDDDVILIPGDISWAMTFKEAIKDFEYINNMKGKKIFLKGNHDYYFSTKTKVNKFLESNNFNTIKVLFNDAIDTDEYIICGTRGWGKTENKDKELDKKIMAREEGRLKISLDKGMKIKKEYLDKGIDKDILVAMHFPPFSGNFKSILEEYGVKKCIYGHLHGFAHTMVKEGLINNIEYVMVGCDYTGFKLVKL